MIKCPKGLKITKCSYGLGIFSKKNFKKGQVIAFVRGGKVDKKEKVSMYALKIPRTDLFWDDIDIRKRRSWDTFLNHSDISNAKMLFDRFNSRRPLAKLIALCDIRKHEEITINYRDYGDRLYKANRYSGLKANLSTLGKVPTIGLGA